MNVSDTKRLTTEGARNVKNAAVKAAEKAGTPVTVAVVDAGGHLLLLERMDGGKFHSVHSATAKAVCAASNKRATGSVGAVGQKLDDLHALGLALAAGPERWTAVRRFSSTANASAASASPAATGNSTRRSRASRWRRSAQAGKRRRSDARRLSGDGLVVGRARRRHEALRQVRDRFLLHPLG